MTRDELRARLVEAGRRGDPVAQDAAIRAFARGLRREALARLANAVRRGMARLHDLRQRRA
jgi:hypothetical protein